MKLKVVCYLHKFVHMLDLILAKLVTIPDLPHVIVQRFEVFVDICPLPFNKR